MLHKVSDFCKKIENIKNISDKLYHLKYNTPKSSKRDAEINYLIEDIQFQCKLIANDKSKYKK